MRLAASILVSIVLAGSAHAQSCYGGGSFSFNYSNGYGYGMPQSYGYPPPFNGFAPQSYSTTPQFSFPQNYAPQPSYAPFQQQSYGVPPGVFEYSLPSFTQLPAVTLPQNYYVPQYYNSSPTYYQPGPNYPNLYVSSATGRRFGGGGRADVGINVMGRQSVGNSFCPGGVCNFSGRTVVRR